MKIKNLNDFELLIKEHKAIIKNIDCEYKKLLRNSNKQYVLIECEKIQEIILNNVNYLNSIKNSYKVIPKKELKSIVRKIQALYLGYLQESKNIQAIIDIWEL